MTNISSVSTGFFPTAQEGFTTTTSGSVASGATTVGLNSVSGYTNGDYVVFVVDPTDTNKKQAFTGQIDTSGVQVTGVKWTEGTNQTHSAGATVVDYETATAWALQRKGWKVEHNEDGIHTLGSSATLTSSKVITSLNDTNGNELLKVTPTSSAVNEVTLANAATGNKPSLSATGDDTNIGIELTPKGTGAFTVGGNPVQHGAWTSWTPTLAGRFTDAKWDKTCKYVQIGKTIHFRIKLVANATTPMAGGTAEAIIPLPVTAVDYAAPEFYFVIGTGGILDAGTTLFNALPIMASTTTLIIRTAITSGSITSTAPMTWTTGDVIAVMGTYEAA